MTLGFIGTGALTSAIVTGLRSGDEPSVPIVLSPRNAETAARLAAAHPDVRIAGDNQEVLDASDTVMLVVRPQVARDVLSELRFVPDHRVVSLIATVPLEEVAALTAPAERVVRALPMPMIAHHQGATIVYPPDREVAALFGGMGEVVEVAQASEFDALSVVTATYATYFKYLDTLHRWLEAHEVDGTKARDYITALYSALANAPAMSPDASFTALSAEYATRGGINEQVVSALTERGVFDVFSETLDAVHRRILGA